MTQEQITQDMLAIAGDLSSRDDLTEDSIVGEAVPDSGTVSGENLALDFRLGTIWTIDKNGGNPKKAWPSNWPSLSFKDLAAALVMFILILCLPLLGKSQLQVQIGAAQTDLKKSAIEFSVQYLRSLDSIISSREKIWFGKHTVFAVTPQFNFQSGTNDALNAIEAKITGLLLSFKTKELHVTRDVIPDFAKPFSSYPMSLGIETNNQFTFLNTLLEVGYVPVFIGRDNPEILKHFKFGAYLQVGYKFKLDTTGQANLDESEEDLNGNIFRAKGSAGFDTRQIVNLGLVRLGLLGNANVWVDLANSAVYHKLDAALRFYLSETNFVDFIYQHGSGAPNFTQGDQYGVGLTIVF